MKTVKIKVAPDKYLGLTTEHGEMRYYITDRDNAHVFRLPDDPARHKAIVEGAVLYFNHFAILQRCEPFEATVEEVAE